MRNYFIFGFFWSFVWYWVALIRDWGSFSLILHFVLFSLFLSCLFWSEMSKNQNNGRKKS